MYSFTELVETGLLCRKAARLRVLYVCTELITEAVEVRAILTK